MGIDADGNTITVVHVCDMCADQTQHDNRNYDVQERAHGSCKLSSDWVHIQQHRTLPPHDAPTAHQSKHAWQALQEKMGRQDIVDRLPPATVVAGQLKHNTNRCIAIDWVNKIGPDT